MNAWGRPIERIIADSFSRNLSARTDDLFRDYVSEAINAACFTPSGPPIQTLSTQTASMLLGMPSACRVHRHGDDGSGPAGAAPGAARVPFAQGRAGANQL
jgi:hypothetical protein